MNNNINVAVGGPINADYPKVYKTKFLKPGIPFSIQVTEPDTKYVIKHNFELDSNITIPENCILEFDGGSISGTYNISGNNVIVKGHYKFNKNITLQGTFYKSIEDRNGKIADLDLLGCSTEESSASKNVAIINSALSLYDTFLFTRIYPINDSIDTHYQFKTFKGNNRENCGVKMIVDNKPIFVFRLKNTEEASAMSRVKVEGLNLTYTNWQINNTESSVFRFLSEGTTYWGWGWFQMMFKDLYIKNAAYIAKENLEPLWDSYWEDILAYDIAHQGFLLDTDAQLQNVFNKVTILNYGHRSDNDHNVTGPCFQVYGELIINNLDIEDWHGRIIHSHTGNISIKDSHIERCYIEQFDMIYAADSLLAENLNIYDIYINNPNNNPSGVFRFNKASIFKISYSNEHIILGNNVMFIGANPNLRKSLTTDFPYKDGMIFPKGWGDTLYNEPLVRFLGGKSIPINKDDLPTTEIPIGLDVFCSNLGIPVYWNGTAWVDATGTPV